MKKILLFLTLLAATVSCDSPKIYYGLGFEEVSAFARGRNRPLCIVLVDRMQYLSGEYERALRKDHANIAGRAVYNIVDIEAPGNDIYTKWLSPLSVPLTCVFSPAGELIDLIPGDGGESFSHIGQAIESRAATSFRWSNRFGLEKARAVPILRDIWRSREVVSSGIFLPRELGRLVDSLKYPYIAALKMQGELMVGDSVSARTTAREMLEMGGPYNLNLYKAEFITAHMVLDPGFDISGEPVIRVEPESVILGERPADKIVPVNITVYNDGGKPLEISNIVPNCSCLRQLGMGRGETLTIAPRDSVVLSFALSPYEEGEVDGGVLLTSNGINKPILNIDIQANFKSKSL